MNPEQPDRRTSLPMAEANLSMKLGEYSVRFKMHYPVGPASPGDFLPAFQSITDLVVRLAVESAETAGRTISCTKGCGACCRQVVPIAPTEARVLADYVNSLPEPRREELRARFASALQRFESAGLAEKLRTLPKLDESECRPFSTLYFAERVPCPFLEDESCSIHSFRPLACREFMVISPAAECANPTPEKVETVPLPASTGHALRRLEGDWLPLILSLEYSESNPPGPPTGTGESVLRDIIDTMARI